MILTIAATARWASSGSQRDPTASFSRSSPAASCALHQGDSAHLLPAAWGDDTSSPPPARILGDGRGPVQRGRSPQLAQHLVLHLARRCRAWSSRSKFRGPFAPSTARDEYQPGASGDCSERSQGMLAARIVGTGSYLPDQRVTNSQLAARWQIDPSWIERKTGVCERRVADGETTVGMAVAAAHAALAAAGKSPAELDLIVTDDKGFKKRLERDFPSCRIMSSPEFEAYIRSL